jgi:hypothetical protein
LAVQLLIEFPEILNDHVAPGPLDAEEGGVEQGVGFSNQPQGDPLLDLLFDDTPVSLQYLRLLLIM